MVVDPLVAANKVEEYFRRMLYVGIDPDKYSYSYLFNGET